MVRHAHDSRSKPEIYLIKTKAKMEQLKEKGEIDIYYLFEEQFLDFWESLKELPPKETVINFDLGFGAKIIHMHLGAATESAMSSIEIIDQVDKEAYYERFLVNVLFRLKDKGLDTKAYDINIKSAYHRWTENKLQLPFPIFESRKKDEQGAGVSVALNKSLHEAYLYVRDGSYYESPDKLKTLFAKAKAYLPKIEAKLPDAIFLQKQFASDLKDDLHSLAALGSGLPRIYLLAMGHLQKEAAAKAESKQEESKKEVAESKPESQKAAGGSNAKTPESKKKVAKKKEGTKNQKFITLDFNENALEATIVAHSEKLTDGSIKVDEKRLIKELDSYGIKFGYDQHLTHILHLISSKQELRGEVVATGKAPAPGHVPHVYPIYLEREEVSEEVESLEAVDIRDSVILDMVDVGDIIGEARYQDGSPGRDVYGNVIHAPVEPGNFKLRIGQNVEVNKDGFYVSQIQGMPQIDEKSISVSPVYIHDGDVNLSSGHLDYDGSIVVKGNVENGGKITATENVKILGSVGLSHIKVGAKLTIQAGVVTTDRGSIHVKGDMEVGFVENSELLVEGNLTVKGSLMNSKVIVASALKLQSKTGVLGGGITIARNRIDAASLGFEQGKKTIVRVGSDWRVERKLAILEGRIVKLEAKHDEESKRFTEVKSKERKKEAIDGVGSTDIKKKMNRINRIKKSLEKKEKALKGQLNWNKDSVIAVRGTLCPNIEVTIGGKKVPVRAAVSGAFITYHIVGEGRINEIKGLRAFEEKYGLR